MSWINDLDALASAGVLGFDAPAYIMGTQPRYYGHPALETLPDSLPAIKNQPQKDEFQSGQPNNNPKWKKWLFGILATAGLIFGASKLKFTKNLINKISLKNIQTYIQKGWNNLKGLFKKPTP